jgi:hypothetical protein
MNVLPQSRSSMRLLLNNGSGTVIRISIRMSLGGDIIAVVDKKKIHHGTTCSD